MHLTESILSSNRVLGAATRPMPDQMTVISKGGLDLTHLSIKSHPIVKI
jgi:hypothetical protein